jgi:hypothetical protein
MPRPNIHQDVNTSGNIVPWSPSVSTPTPTYGGSYGREERAFQGESSVSHPVYDSGRGNGNDGTGVNNINDVINETITADTTPMLNNPTDLDDEIWALAVQAADPITNPGYALSYEGKELIKQGIQPGSETWIKTFGLPQIIGTTSKAYDKEGRIIGLGDPITTGIRRGDTTTGYMDEYGQIIEGGSPIMSGQGKYLMDQYDEPGTYEEKVDDYYEMREAEQAQQPDKDPNYGYGYGYSGGSSRGTGYFGGSTGFPQVASAHRMHQGWLDTLYKGRTQPGQEVQKMLASNQKVDAANILSGLSQGAQAFAMDPKTRGILTVLQA